MSCSCPRSKTVRSDGYGGPDVSSMTDLAFDSLSDFATSGFGSQSFDSNPNSSSSSSSSFDSGSSYSGGSDSF